MWSAIATIFVALCTAITAYLKTTEKVDNNAEKTIEELKKAKKAVATLNDDKRKRLRDKYGYK